MRPITLLLALLIAATLGGAVAYSNYQRAIFAGQRESDSAGRRDTVEAPRAAASAAPDEKPDALNRKVAFLEDQVALLKRENKSLAEAVEKLKETIKAKPEMTAAPTSAVTPEALVRDVEQIRELKFKRPLEFVRVPSSEIESRLRKAVEASLSPEAAQVRVRAAVAVGLVREPFDLIEALAGLAFEQAGGFHDRTASQMLIDKDADFEARPDLKGKLVMEIAHALLHDHFDQPRLAGIGSDNDDTATALRGLFIGDAVATKIHHGVVDALNNDYSRAQQPATPAQFTKAPLYLRETFLFPFMMSADFAKDVQPDENRASRNAAFLRPVRSTAEILHPELYKRVPPFQPVAIPWPDTRVDGTAPFFDNVIGEFGINILFKGHLGEDVAFTAAVGWQGDRYVCYPGDEKNGDHVFWQSVWESEAHAIEFAKAAQTVFLHRYSIPWNKRYQQPDGSFIVNDPYRVLRFRFTPDKKGVTIVNATRAEFADAIERTFLR